MAREQLSKMTGEIQSGHCDADSIARLIPSRKVHCIVGHRRQGGKAHNPLFAEQRHSIRITQKEKLRDIKIQNSNHVEAIVLAKSPGHACFATVRAQNAPSGFSTVHKSKAHGTWGRLPAVTSQKTGPCFGRSQNTACLRLPRTPGEKVIRAGLRRGKLLASLPAVGPVLGGKNDL